MKKIVQHLNTFQAFNQPVLKSKKMKSTDYTQFDQKILMHLEVQPMRFNYLCAAVEKEAKAISPIDSFRVTDRRLQALRKKGLVKFSWEKGWSKNHPDDQLKQAV